MLTSAFFKGDDAIISLDDVTNKILSRDPNYAVDVFMWPKFGNSSISHFYKDLTRKNAFFEGWFWFKFNNLGLGKNLKFYISVVKGLKLKVRKFLELIPTFGEVTKEKLVVPAFSSFAFSANSCNNFSSIFKVSF